MDNKICRPRGQCTDILSSGNKSTYAKSSIELAKCIKQRKALCNAIAPLLFDADAVASVFEKADLVGESSKFVADMYDGIEEIYKRCRSHITVATPKEKRLLNKTLKELHDKMEWARAERDSIDERERELKKSVMKGDLGPFEDLANAMDRAIRGEESEEEQIREAVKEKYGYEKDDGEDDDEFAET